MTFLLLNCVTGQKRFSLSSMSLSQCVVKTAIIIAEKLLNLLKVVGTIVAFKIRVIKWQKLTLE